MLLFNPIECPEFCNPLLSYLDPDSNSVTRLPTSKYVVEEEINGRLDYANNNINFSTTHLNAWSLLGNLRNLFSVIGVSETCIPLQNRWISLDTIFSPTIVGLNPAAELAFIYKMTLNTNFDGIAIYLNLRWSNIFCKKL